MAPKLHAEDDFESLDGTRIRFQSYGKGKPIVMANGLGGTFAAWRHVYRALGDRYRILCWDYRGLYGSDRPNDLTTLTVPGHCRDLDVLVRREGVEEAVFVGWSMGTQVNFEYYRMRPELFKGLILLNGTCGTPFDTALGFPGAKQIINAGLEIMRGQPKLVAASAGLATQWTQLIPLLQKLGLVGETLDQEIFAELASDFVNLDFEVYAETLKRLGDHNACDVVPGVRCPALILTGDRDIMTPVKTAERMRDQMGDCELVVLAGATHYAAVEFPEQVIAAIERFLQRIGY